MKKVSVIGAGSWGTAIAFVLAENGHDCLLWARREEQSTEINDKNQNSAYLPKVTLPKNLTSDFKSRTSSRSWRYTYYCCPYKCNQTSLRRNKFSNY